MKKSRSKYNYKSKYKSKSKKYKNSKRRKKSQNKSKKYQKYQKGGAPCQGPVEAASKVGHRWFECRRCDGNGKKTCSACHGVGSWETSTECAECSGSGDELYVDDDGMENEDSCQVCAGTGERIEAEICPRCEGNGEELCGSCAGNQGNCRTCDAAYARQHFVWH